MTEFTAEDRWDWLLRSPGAAANLFRLLDQGKGTAEDFTKLVDRVLGSERAALAKAAGKDS